MTTPRRRALAPAASLALLLLAGSALPARAMNPAQIRGTVTDTAGAPLGEISIRFTSLQAGRAPRTATTNAKGRFSLPFIEWGEYTVELESEGWGLSSFVLEEKGQRKRLSDPLEGTLAPGQDLTIELQPSHQYRLDLVLETAGERERLEREMERADLAGGAKEASDLLRRGDAEGALAEAEALLAAEPDNGFAHYIKGMALLSLSRSGEAVAALERASELIPDQPGVHFGLGTCKLEEADRKADLGQEAAARALRVQAAAELEKERSLSPGAPEVLTNLALAYFKAGDNEKAAPVFEELLEARPDDLNAYFILSDVYNQLGRPEEAMGVLDRLPETGRDAAVGFYNVAVNLMNEGRPEPALAALRRAVEMDPTHAKSHRLLGMAHLQLGSQEEAIASMKRFLELAPDDPDAESTRSLVEYLESQG